MDDEGAVSLNDACPLGGVLADSVRKRSLDTNCCGLMPGPEGVTVIKCLGDWGPKALASRGPVNLLTRQGFRSYCATTNYDSFLQVGSRLSAISGVTFFLWGLLLWFKSHGSRGRPTSAFHCSLAVARE